MKPFLATFAFLLLSFDASAEQAKKDNETSLCESISGLAKQIYVGRQQGVSMSTAMKAFPNDNPFKNLAHALVIDAYKEPRWQTDEARINAIQEFENRAYLQCIQSMKKAR